MGLSFCLCVSRLLQLTMSLGGLFSCYTITNMYKDDDNPIFFFSVLCAPHSHISQQTELYQPVTLQQQLSSSAMQNPKSATRLQNLSSTFDPSPLRGQLGSSGAAPEKVQTCSFLNGWFHVRPAPGNESVLSAARRHEGSL